MNPFKAYDIRGTFPAEINKKFSFFLGKALAQELQSHTAIIGHDCRLSSPELAQGLAFGLMTEKCKVNSLELCCTEEIYFAMQTRPYDLGIMITGSHNPANENGFKIMRSGAVPVSGDSGLKNVEKRLVTLFNVNASGHEVNEANAPAPISVRQDYCNWLLEYTGLNREHARNLKIVADCGNGCASLILKKLQDLLPFELILLNENPDGNFPNGVPNPLLPEKRADASRAVLEHQADFGIAFDGDADRCFFYDHTGRFIEGYYLVGLLAEQLLSSNPGEKIIHDPRLYWNTKEIVEQAGGIPIRTKTGHAFIKERMRKENAIYGGEMSAHHYFRDFGYCDSGMLPWLFVSALLCKKQNCLANLVSEQINRYPCSGEINRKLHDPDKAIEKVRDKYLTEAVKEDDLDGLNMEFKNWRFNLRKSNTESLLRLNVESRGDSALMRDKTLELLNILEI